MGLVVVLAPGLAQDAPPAAVGDVAELFDVDVDQLTALLRRLAADQGLAEHWLPGAPQGPKPC